MDSKEIYIPIPEGASKLLGIHDMDFIKNLFNRNTQEDIKSIESGIFFVPDDPNRVTGWTTRGDCPGRPIQD